MSKSSSTAILSHIKSFEGEAADYRKIFEALAEQIPFAQVLLVTTFPRGGTQVLQPTQSADGFLRAYSREAFISDAPTWQAIVRGGAIAGDECVPSGKLESSDYYRQIMEPFGLAHVAAAKLERPLFRGYPGALHLYRKVGDKPFTRDELRTLGHVADELDAVLSNYRESRIAAGGQQAPWEELGCCRQFIFDSNGRQVNLYPNNEPVDDALRDEIRKLVTSRLQDLNGEAVTSDRVEFPDSNGELWAFRVTVYRTFPALGNGAYVMLCLQPPTAEWEAVRPVDFQADPEVARLVPTLKFMKAEFHRMPTLDEIAGKAHLSPFHFHRRFTALLGQTPKHFLLACQIRQAKRMLMERKVPLAEIAALCGFAHQSHFTSRFKQATGLTPTRWRRFMTDRQSGDESRGKRSQRSPGCAV